MAGFGGFYKGEQKKPKKRKDMKQGSGVFGLGAPIFRAPEVISKKKNY